MSIWVNGKEKKSAQRAHIQEGKCMAWVGLGPRLCPRVSLRVYSQEPRSERGWERLILHQRLRVCSVPGVGTTLHVSPRLTPPQNRGLCGTLFNQLLHHNTVVFPSYLNVFRPELMLVAAVFGWQAHNLTCTASSVTRGNKERRHHYNLGSYYLLACFHQISDTPPGFN